MISAERTVGGLAAVVVLAGGALLMSGAGNGLLPARSTLPPCEQQPSYADAQRALGQHPDDVRALRAVGSGVDVAATRTCGAAARGVITVRYGTDEEKAAIERVVNTHDGFGVPIDVARR
ncbi:hypothetical protein [Luteipulveratus flavus]|uniref:DUF4189 domain-containing protein n=1 Tax=Luteipulveratus flavus TaxID=3031728 RepID=A0ABT6C6G9_9MICO|nr:hypothetical protein [Luteipulveratus sp. YIM 133296]MDF8263922.1 hypothetical protein [Luteipulveratus sp. YIM 133296]